MNEEKLHYLFQSELEKIVRHAIEHTLCVALQAHPNVKQQWFSAISAEENVTRIINEATEPQTYDEIMEAAKAQYKTNGCLGHGCNCEKRGQFQCGDSSLESADYSRLGNAFAVHGSSDSSARNDAETSECKDCGIEVTGTNPREHINGCIQQDSSAKSAKSSRNPPTPVSPVGKLQEGVILTEIKSIMRNIWERINDMQDMLCQIDRCISPNDWPKRQNDR